MRKKDSTYIIVIIGLIIDQIIKFLVRKNLKVLASIPLIPHFLHLTHVENEGAAWGVLSNNTTILIFISFIIFLAILKYIKEEPNWSPTKTISFGLVLSGMMGNLIDRILYHSVTDYLDFTIFFYHYPVFNVADIFIVIGAMILIIDLVRSERYEHRSSKPRKRIRKN